GEAIAEECADVSNVLIASLINPPAGQKDVVGSTDKIEVSIVNESLKSYFNVGITAQIEDGDGQVLGSPLTGTVATIAASSTPQSFAFSPLYTVPNLPTYVIKVFLNQVDIYTEDDTLKDTRTTTYTGISETGRNELTLGQNIPNPANNSTRIDYSVPEAGKVIFHVHSITGQLLYSKTIEAPRGAHSIELNTSTFAAGVYFYSMEYKGQRLVRQLIISD
ncbi:MAG: T9SS type A sorting domain-containing protein, partial [Bacteroidales bacterium]|nr:T9SS type A sorting domain-containing protein [Bacteroidales bacterium]